METKFTKGEWKVGEGITSIECENDFIATCHHIAEQWITEEQAIANAKLIAAAPELLEACVCLAGLKDLVLPPEPVKWVSEEFMSKFIALNNLIKMADSAIKKATE